MKSAEPKSHSSNAHEAAEPFFQPEREESFFGDRHEQAPALRRKPAFESEEASIQTKPAFESEEQSVQTKPERGGRTPESVASENAFFTTSGDGGFFSKNGTPFFMPAGVQTKLTVGKPNDRYEREADAVAERVVDGKGTLPSPATPALQLKCAECEQEEQQQEEEQRGGQEEGLQKKAVAGSDDAAADEDATSTTTPAIQAKCAACEHEEQEKQEGGSDSVAQRKPAFDSEADEPLQTKSQAPKSPSGLEQQLQSSKGRGKPLAPSVQGEMEQQMGADFSGVRVHTGRESVQMNQGLNAQAFTHGSDIYFSENKYNTESREGKKLLAHELTHTVQQGAAQRRSDGEVAQTSPEEHLARSPDDQVVQRLACPPSNPPAPKPPEDKEEPDEEEKPKEIESTEGASVDERQEQAPDPEEFAPEAEENITEEAKAEGEATDEETLDEEAAEGEGEEKGEGEAAAEGEAEALGAAAGVGGDGQVNPEGLGEAASPDLMAERDETTSAEELALAALNDTATQLSTVASGGVQFADQSPDIIKGQPEAERKAYLGRKVQSDAIASVFLTSATGRVHDFIQQGRQVAELLRAGTEEKKAALQARIQQKRSQTMAVMEQLRNQAKAEAAMAKAQILISHTLTVLQVQARTLQAKLQVEQAFQTASQQIDEKKTAQLLKLEQLYTQADTDYRAVGPRVGQKAINEAEIEAQAYESKKTGEKDGFWDGYLTDNRWQARADTARETGEQYRDGLKEEGNKQADAAMEGKPKDIETANAIATQSLEHLTAAKDQTLDALDASEQRTIQNADQTRDSLFKTVEESLNATVASLNEQEASQLQFLMDYGTRQAMAIERDAQKAAASVVQGVTDAALQLLQTLSGFKEMVQGMEAPEPGAFQGVVDGLSQALDASIAQAVAQTQAGAEASKLGLDQGAEQALLALDTYSASGLDNARKLGNDFSTTLTSLVQEALQGFEQLFQTFDTTTQTLIDTALQTFTAVTDGVQQVYTTIAENLRTRFTETVAQLEQGLIQVLESDMKRVICEEAEKAAKDVQPWWKSVLKILLVIIVIVVVALVIGPAVIGAVGAAAGALGASAGVATFIGATVGGAIVGGLAGGVIQMGNNVIDGKNVMDGVGKAVIVGAIGGALGGAGGALAQGLTNAGRLGAAGLMQSSMKFGIEMAFDVAGGVLGDLAVGNPITLEGVVMGAAIGGAVSISTANLGGLGRLGAAAEGIQTKSMGFGSGVGTKVGAKVKTAIKGPAGADVSVPKAAAEPSVKPDEPSAKPGEAAEPSAKPGEAAEPSAKPGEAAEPAPKPGDAEARADSVENTKNLEGGELTPAQVRAEIEEGFAKGDVRKITDPKSDYDLEVELPNGHKYRRNRNGKWCRYTREFCYTGGLYDDLGPRSYEDIGAENQAIVDKETLYPDETVKAQHPDDPEFKMARRHAAEEGSSDLVHDMQHSELGGVDRICFPAGTPVKTAQGAVPIESVTVGDFVYSYNEAASKVEARRVSRVFSTQPHHLFLIYCGEQLVRTTGSHPFWVSNRKRWIEAKNLRPGMKVLTIEGKDLVITSVEAVEEHLTTYNFTVEDNHTYFVGQPGILVHNAKKRERRPDFSSMETSEVDFYIIRDKKTGKVYVGQADVDRGGYKQRFTEHIGEGRRKGGWKKNLTEKLPSGDARFTVEKVGQGRFNPIGAAITERHLAVKNGAFGSTGYNKHTIVSEDAFNDHKEKFSGPCI